MAKNLNELINEYGAETIIARIMEQLKILAKCEDAEVIASVEGLIENTGCDTEYIYSLCEYGNLVTYVSEDIKITESPWFEE
ncbi:hypothetical protein J2Z42_002173 [Clostridium algifaecis]|uniref:Uncharacterized protein n=1 Tax=Clostridium algifaecis TaxID=1472040 RepID=A0ABS4KV37_9CLOT|nr:hypothetical protein [Clostridium algifaecis]MBP2033470.1 hypothetical protein [Clostridium algifaecis]